MLDRHPLAPVCGHLAFGGGGVLGERKARVSRFHPRTMNYLEK
jgi:hypothetical protein